MSETSSDTPKLPESSGNRAGGPSDNPTLQISPIKLDETNYLPWSRSCLLFIKARGMYGYITGEKKRPATEGPLFGQWDSENSLVMSWLLNSMQPSIARGYILLDSACKIWNAASQTYSQLGNDAQVYELRKKVHETKQRDMTVAQYYAELSSLWQELDFYQDFQADCSNDAVKFQKLIEKERVYDFLAGLNVEYDQTRAQILGRDPFPSLRQTYSRIQQEESRRNAMLYPAVPERSAMVVHPVLKNVKGQARQNEQGVMDKDQLKCDYCGRSRHTKETCWKLHGRPGKGSGGKRVGPLKSQVHLSEAVEDSIPVPCGGSTSLSKEELQTLRSLMAKVTFEHFSLKDGPLSEDVEHNEKNTKRIDDRTSEVIENEESNKKIDDKASEDVEDEESDLCDHEGNCSAKRSKRGGGRLWKWRQAARVIIACQRLKRMMGLNPIERHFGAMEVIGHQISRRNMSPPSTSSLPEQLASEHKIQHLVLLDAVEDDYRGITINVNEPMDSNDFVHLLRASIAHWRQQGKEIFRIKFPVQLSHLIRYAVKEGFKYLYSEPDYKMLVYRIPDSLHTNYAFVISDKRESPESLQNKQIDEKASEDDVEDEESNVREQEDNCSGKKSKRGGGRRGRALASICEMGNTIQPTPLFTTETLRNHPSMYIRLGRNPPERNLVPQVGWSRAFDIWSTAAVVYKGLLHEAGFGDFLKIQPYVFSLRGYMSALVERYFSETHTLHLGTFEIGPTPLAWTMITGIRFDGDPLNPPNISRSECAELLGFQNTRGIFSEGKVKLDALCPSTLDFSKDPADGDLDWMFRRLVVYLVGSCFFSGIDLKVPIHLVSAMSDVRRINQYDWGAATFSAFLRGMRKKTSECSGSFSGFYTFLLFWAYEHLPCMQPVTKLGVDTFPRACRWESTETRPHILSDFIWFRLELEYLEEDEVNFDPYKNLTEKGCYQCEAELSQKRIFFQGLESCEVYMGERNLRQFGGRNWIPQPPPAKRFYGRSDDSIWEFPLELFFGSNAWDLVEDEELDYAEWFRTHSLGRIVDLEQFSGRFTLGGRFLEPWLRVHRDWHKMMPPQDLQTLQETPRKWKAKCESVEADLKAAFARANKWEAEAKSLEAYRGSLEWQASYALARVAELEAICS